MAIFIKAEVRTTDSLAWKRHETMTTDDVDLAAKTLQECFDRLEVRQANGEIVEARINVSIG